MKLNYKKILAFIFSFCLLVLLPLVITYAQQGGGVNTTIKNPLQSDDVKGLLVSIMKLVEVVGGIVVAFFIILSGYKFVTAGDSDTERTKAKEMFYATIIGGAILLGASVIAEVVVNTVKATTGARF